MPKFCRYGNFVDVKNYHLNINSIRVRLPQVLDWLTAESPDIFALQETKIINPLFPTEEFKKPGYQTFCNG